MSGELLAGHAALRALLGRIAVPGEAPGAVAAAGVAAAVAAAVGASGTSGSSGDELRRLLRRVLEAADDDVVAYWSTDRGSDAIDATPGVLADLASEIAVAASAVEGGNIPDLLAARALAHGAAAASRIIGSSNRRLADRREAPAIQGRSSRLLVPAAVPGTDELLVAERAVGCWYTDADGLDWLDATAGMWNVPLGHGHPAPIEAMLEQLVVMAATDPFQVTMEVGERTAAKVADLLGMPDGYVLFGSSGSEVIEAAMRLGLSALPPDSPVWAAPSAFHGSTAGAAALSGLDGVWGPLPASSRWPTTAETDHWQGPGLAFVEPARAVDGCELLTARQVAGVRGFQREGGLVVVDEVATGLGRAGWPTVSQGLEIEPDMVVLGKGLGNGVVPVSALVVREHVIRAAFEGGPVDFGHTHSNHPASLAAAAASLDTLGAVDIAGRSDAFGSELAKSRLPTTGQGFFRAVRGGVAHPRQRVMAALVEARLVCHVPTALSVVDSLVVAPPLTITDSELVELRSRLDHVAEVLGW